MSKIRKTGISEPCILKVERNIRNAIYQRNIVATILPQYYMKMIKIYDIIS